MSDVPIERVASALDIIYRGEPWYHCTGVAKDHLVIYVRNRRHPKDLPQEFFGYKVKVYMMGELKPAAITR